MLYPNRDAGITGGRQAPVVAVVVTYFPDLGLLGRQLTCLLPQVAHIVIIDNGSTINLKSWNAQRTLANTSAATHVIALGENRGIAAAQNAGIAWAQQQQAEFVLLMDQDSIPAPDMVASLLSAIVALPAPVAAAGPRYWDERQGGVQQNLASFIRLVGLGLRRYACHTADAIIPVSYLVSSGCLIPLPVLGQVGGMREDLFIDYVDFEWGLRAAHHGFYCYGICAARLQHRLGDSHITFFNKKIPLHNPLRHYYLLRNAVLLYQEAWIPLQWKLADAWRLVVKCVFYVIFAPERATHGYMMLKGIWHGLKGKTGRYSAS